MGSINLQTDQKMDDVINYLKIETKEEDLAKLFRLGLASLKLIVDGQKEGLQTIQVDPAGKLKKEISISDNL